MATSRFGIFAPAHLAFGLCCVALALPLRADPLAEFYKGKTLNLVSGFTPNGEFDSSCA